MNSFDSLDWMTAFSYSRQLNLVQTIALSIIIIIIISQLLYYKYTTPLRFKVCTRHCHRIIRHLHSPRYRQGKFSHQVLHNHQFIIIITIHYHQKSVFSKQIKGIVHVLNGFSHELLHWNVNQSLWMFSLLSPIIPVNWHEKKLLTVNISLRFNGIINAAHCQLHHAIIKLHSHVQWYWKSAILLRGRRSFRCHCIIFLWGHFIWKRIIYKIAVQVRRWHFTMHWKLFSSQSVGIK